MLGAGECAVICKTDSKPACIGWHWSEQRQWAKEISSSPASHLPNPASESESKMEAGWPHSGETGPISRNLVPYGQSQGPGNGLSLYFRTVSQHTLAVNTQGTNQAPVFKNKAKTVTEEPTPVWWTPQPCYICSGQRQCTGHFTSMGPQWFLHKDVSYLRKPQIQDYLSRFRNKQWAQAWASPTLKYLSGSLLFQPSLDSGHCLVLDLSLPLLSTPPHPVYLHPLLTG